MITTVSGTNDYRRNSELTALLNKFSKNYKSDLSIERLDAEEQEFSSIKDSLQSLPFLTPKKMIILSEPSKHKQFIEEAETLLSEVADNIDVVVLEPKLDKRSTYYKYLKTKTNFFEYNEEDSRNLSHWAGEYVREQQGKIDSRSSQLLIDRVGTNQLMLKNELDKLLLFNKEINEKTITELTEPTPQSSIFQLIDAAVKGDKVGVIRLYEEQKAQKVEPPQIMALIAWQLHVMALIKLCGDVSVDQIIERTKLNPFVVRKNLGVCRKLTMQSLRQAINDALDLDVRLKTENVNLHEAIEYYLITLID